MSFPLLLRGFVVLGVMLMHTTWYFSHAHAESWVTISEMLLDIISLFAVPLVMFVSGYMFISHNRHADYYKWSFFRRMFLSVLSPYLLFSLLYLGGAWFFSNASFTLKQAAYLIITGSSAVHMAFFRALFGFYAIYPLLLRYFNPIGAHSSGLIGENPNGVPNNLMPYITQVAAGKLKELHVFGNDYPTPDGTGVRDYIHVVDLAKGHVKALKAIDDKCGIEVYNLGTGIGYSVLDLVKAFEKANGIKIPYVIDQRRAGDIATCYSDPSKAWEKLGWKAELGIEDMCRDSWNWQKNNPNGFEA